MSRDRNKIGKYHFVYIIGDYAGVSQIMVERKRMHKADKNIEQMQVVKAYTNRKDAEAYEAHLHSLGYKGEFTTGDRTNHSKSMTGRIRKDFEIAAISRGKLGCYVIYKGKQYKSLRDAEKQTGVSRYNIRKSIHGL